MLPTEKVKPSYQVNIIPEEANSLASLETPTTAGGTKKKPFKVIDQGSLKGLEPDSKTSLDSLNNLEEQLKSQKLSPNYSKELKARDDEKDEIVLKPLEKPTINLPKNSPSQKPKNNLLKLSDFNLLDTAIKNTPTQGEPALSMLKKGYKKSSQDKLSKTNSLNVQQKSSSSDSPLLINKGN
mmetsp:Transcript_16527/g.14297  ORF Transcript_16527/g.14297 Transcript_16527/m.14297 type:complete len:182 (-) Transcript_16527:804-1349(-)